MQLKDKVVLVAGASSGIGRNVALQLSKNNNSIIICARRQQELDELAAEIEKNGSKALSIT